MLIGGQICGENVVFEAYSSIALARSMLYAPPIGDGASRHVLGIHLPPDYQLILAVLRKAKHGARLR